MKRICLLLALLAALLCAACAERAESTGESGYELYYVSRSTVCDGGDAIRTDVIRLDSTAGTAALAEQLVRQLLTQPENGALRSAFPEGTELRRLSVAGGRATVDLSAQYERLSGVDLSIADACVTLTLTQLDGIYAVRLTADGKELPYRKTQLLTAADALLSVDEDVIRTLNVSLYFLDTETGALRAQQQTLALYEGQTRLSAVLDALKRGPEGDDTLRRLLGDDFSVLSSRTEDGVCSINLDGRSLFAGDEPLRALTMESLARSLLSLDGVDEVQFLVDGEIVPKWTAAALAPAEPAES